MFAAFEKTVSQFFGAMAQVSPRISQPRNIQLHQMPGKGRWGNENFSRTYSIYYNNKVRGRLSPEFNDFKDFYSVVGEIPRDKYLARFDVTKPFAFDNWKLVSKPQKCSWENSFSYHHFN